MNTKHKFPYEWKLKEAQFTKDKGSVFECFACGGGSTMGYKLAGFDVIGCNEIDPKMMEVYRTNHNPQYSFLEPIQDFKNRKDLPEELFHLDILSGSPPCSSFSLSGNREKDWGKEKKFREGQAEQVLDTLFFDFIDLAKRLQPKVVIAENVKGILIGNAKKYTHKIHEEFEKAGYYVQHHLLDASKMGVPQKRERVFFIALRKDLATPFLYNKDIFTLAPNIKLSFNEPIIPFSEIEDATDYSIKNDTVISQYYHRTKPGKTFSTVHPQGFFFNNYKTNKNHCLYTIAADPNHGAWHYSIQRMLNDIENIKASTFPLDYDFKSNKAKYIVGMSVPPVMTAQIASEVYDQWLSKL